MAQSGFTPISIYYSTTASAVPTAANLVPGELAINTADGKLYYEDSSGVVQVLATKSTGSIGGSNTQVQFNNSGSLGGSSGLTWDGSFLTTSSIKNSALTSGRVTYAGASGLLSDSAGLTYDGTNLTLANTVGVTSNLTTNQAAGTSGSPLNLDLNFKGYINTTMARIRSWDESGSTGFGYLTFWTNNGTTLAEKMRITSAGNVGIGTSSPNSKLTVTGGQTRILNSTAFVANPLDNGSWSGAITVNTNDGSGDLSGLGMYVNSSYGAGCGIFAKQTSSTTADLTFFTGSGVGASNKERMRIDSSGNVGIGATSAGNKLQISNGGANGVEFDVALASGTESKMLSINRSSSAYTPLNYDASLHKFFISGGEKMRLDASGNLLVGTTTTRANAGDVQVSKGISFPATQSASSDANTLDDYEEGTWTPNQGSCVVVGTFGSAGTYTKIGRLVTVNIAVTGSTSISITAGSAICTNLPFSVLADGIGAYGTGKQDPSSTILTLLAYSTSVFSTLASGAGTGLYMTITYMQS